MTQPQRHCRLIFRGATEVLERLNWLYELLGICCQSCQDQEQHFLTLQIIVINYSGLDALTMRLASIILLLVILTSGLGDLVKVYDFGDYRDTPEETSGVLKLKQDESNPLILPPQYTLCTRVYKWYERMKYTPFGTITLLDDFGNVTYQYFHGICWDGGFRFREYHQTKQSRRANDRKYSIVDKAFETHEWGHVCYSADFTNGTWKVVYDGVRVLPNYHDPTKDRSDEYETRTSIWDSKKPKYTIKPNQRFELELGFHRTLPTTLGDRIIGMQTGLNIYGRVLDDDTLKKITTCKLHLPGDVVNWETAEWTTDRPDLIKPLNISENDVCVNNSKEFIFVIPHQIQNHQMGYDRCEALGITKVIPLSRYQHEQVFIKANSLALKKHCHMKGRIPISFGMRQRRDLDLYSPQSNASMDYIRNSKWGSYKTTRDSGYWAYTGKVYKPDVIKTLAFSATWKSLTAKFTYEVCFACTSHVRPLLTVRGLCSGSAFDTQVKFSINKDGFVEYYGTKRTLIKFDYDKNMWIMTSLSFPRTIARASAQGHTLALGSKSWVFENERCGKAHVEKLLKITTCTEGQYTCEDGRCVDISTRCNSVNDCNDWSDEKNCNLVVFPESYFKKFAPFAVEKTKITKVNVEVSVDVLDVIDVSENRKSIELKYVLFMQWKDLRLTFRNLQPDSKSNVLTSSQMDLLWFPILTFTNTNDNEKVVMDDETTMTVINKGEPTYSSIEDVDENSRRR